MEKHEEDTAPPGNRQRPRRKQIADQQRLFRSPAQVTTYPERL
jgi:hypothetical protein